jgi:hypothetical protein
MNKITNEENKTTNKDLTTFIVEINNAIQSVRKSSIEVFILLKDANEKLINKDYKELKKKINLDTSTFNKIEKIFSNSIVMDNLELLPTSWGTLYECSQLDVDTLLEKITDGSINLKSTKEQVKNIRKEQTDPSAVQDHKSETIELSAKSDNEICESETNSNNKDKRYILTMKDSAKEHKKEMKELLVNMKVYFYIPSDLELFFSDSVEVA